MQPFTEIQQNPSGKLVISTGCVRILILRQSSPGFLRISNNDDRSRLHRLFQSTFLWHSIEVRFSYWHLFYQRYSVNNMFFLVSRWWIILEIIWWGRRSVRRRFIVIRWGRVTNLLVLRHYKIQSAQAITKLWATAASMYTLKACSTQPC